MITVSELKEACEKIEREWGSDSPVCIQLFNDGGDLLLGDYCRGIIPGVRGTLYLNNVFSEKKGD